MPTPPSFNIPTLPEAPFEVPPMPTMPELSALPTDFPDIPELPGVDLGGAAQASARVGHGVRASIHASMAYLPEMPEVPAEMPSRMFHPMDFVSNVDLASLPTDGLSNLAVPPTTEEATAWVNATGYASAEAAEASAHAAADAAEIASEVAGSLETGSQRALRRATGFVSTASRLPLRMPRFVGPSQALREATFFPLSGMSLDEIIARRGWSHVYADGTAWERAVCDVTKGRAVKFQTADGRKLSAMWCPRVYDSELKEREFQRLLVGSRPGMESGGLGSMGTGGIELPSEAAVIIFHANAMVMIVTHARILMIYTNYFEDEVGRKRLKRERGVLFELAEVLCTLTCHSLYMRARIHFLFPSGGARHGRVRDVVQPARHARANRYIRWVRRFGSSTRRPQRRQQLPRRRRRPILAAPRRLPGFSPAPHCRARLVSWRRAGSGAGSAPQGFTCVAGPNLWVSGASGPPRGVPPFGLHLYLGGRYRGCNRDSGPPQRERMAAQC